MGDGEEEEETRPSSTTRNDAESESTCASAVDISRERLSLSLSFLGQSDIRASIPIDLFIQSRIIFQSNLYIDTARICVFFSLGGSRTREANPRANTGERRVPQFRISMRGFISTRCYTRRVLIGPDPPCAVPSSRIVLINEPSIHFSIVLQSVYLVIPPPVNISYSYDPVIPPSPLALIFRSASRVIADHRENEPRRVPQPVARLTRKYCKLLSPPFTVLSGDKRAPPPPGPPARLLDPRGNVLHLSAKDAR